jgi:hypothetical protein
LLIAAACHYFDFSFHFHYCIAHISPYAAARQAPAAISPDAIYAAICRCRCLAAALIFSLSFDYFHYY